MKRLITAMTATALAVGGVAATGTGSLAAEEYDAAHVGYVGALGDAGHAELYAWGMATAQNGNILVGDYWNQRVAEYTPSGAYVGDFVNNPGYGEEGHQSPYGLAVDQNDGSVYVADTDRRRVIKYDKNGDWLFKVGTNNVSQPFGQSYSGPGYFRYPSRVAVRSDGWFFVIDTWERDKTGKDGHVVAHTPSGEEKYFFGGQGNRTEVGKLAGPHGADFDAKDRLFVADAQNKQVRVFNTTNTGASEVNTFGSEGTGPGQFVGDIRGLCVDKPRDVLYVVDGRGNRVSKWTTDGTFVKSFGGAYNGRDLAPDGMFSDGGRACTVDRSGNVWVADMPNFRAQKFSPDGNHLLSIPTNATAPAAGSNGPRSVTVGADGDVYVVDTYNWQIDRYAADGAYKSSWGTRGSTKYKFNYARSADADPATGDVVVADTDNNKIKKYDRNGEHIWTYGWKPGDPDMPAGDKRVISRPHGVDVARDGRIAIASTDFPEIQVWNRDGSFVAKFGKDQLQRPRGVAWGPDGTLWVADTVGDDIQQFRLNGDGTATQLQRFGNGILTNSFDIAVGAAEVYVADTEAHVVHVFSTTGTYKGEFGGRGKQAGFMNSPQGLELVGNTLYVAEQGNDRIQLFAVNGSSPAPSAPGAPTNVVAEAGEGTVTVSWGPAPSAGGAITGYTVTASPGGETCSTGGFGTSCTVRGLEGGTAYTMSVTATNAGGTGPAATSAPVTPDGAVDPDPSEPGLPGSVAAIPGSGSVSVAWTAAPANGSRITGYKVTATPGGQTCTTAGTSCTVYGLTNGTTYTMSVVATNGVGTGLAATSAPVTPQASIGPEPEYERYSGASRYDTAIEVSKATFPSGAPFVVVASGENYPDALSAGPLAARKGGPLLLTKPTAVPEGVLAEIERLNPEKIVLAGGEAAVSADVLKQLRVLAPTTRVAGAERYETSANLARKAFSKKPDVAYVATGVDFPDALAAGPVAFQEEAPILLTKPNTVPAATLAALRDLEVTKVVLVGGENAVSNQVRDQIDALTGVSVERVAGASRYETAARLALRLVQQSEGPLDLSAIYVATGANFPDALAGGVAAALEGAPLLLTRTECRPAVTDSQIRSLAPDSVVALGGTSAVSDAALRGARC